MLRLKPNKFHMQSLCRIDAHFKPISSCQSSQSDIEKKTKFTECEIVSIFFDVITHIDNHISNCLCPILNFWPSNEFWTHVIPYVSMSHKIFTPFFTDFIFICSIFLWKLKSSVSRLLQSIFDRVKHFQSYSPLSIALFFFFVQTRTKNNVYYI